MKKITFLLFTFIINVNFSLASEVPPSKKLKKTEPPLTTTATATATAEEPIKEVYLVTNNTLCHLETHLTDLLNNHNSLETLIKQRADTEVKREYLRALILNHTLTYEKLTSQPKKESFTGEVVALHTKGVYLKNILAPNGESLAYTLKVTFTGISKDLSLKDMKGLMGKRVHFLWENSAEKVKKKNTLSFPLKTTIMSQEKKS